MGVLFVFGRSGSGKSRYAYDLAIRESVSSPEHNIIVLVPEQFTVQAEKDLCALHPGGGLINIQVLSFARLAHRVFEEVGTPKEHILDNEGKDLILRKVAKQEEKNLSLLKGNLKKQGYIGEARTLISEFKQYHVGLNELDEVLKALDFDSVFFRKLKDIRTVYEGFEKFFQDRYLTNEDIFDALADVLPKSTFLRDSTLILDGFTGFTPVQDKLIEAMLSLCKRFVLTVLIGEGEDPFSYGSAFQLFALSKQTVKHVVQAAVKRKIKIEEPVWTKDREHFRFSSAKALDFLESELFRYTSRKFYGPQENIRIYVAKDPQKESDFVASTIRHLVRKEKMKYRDIAVLASDLDAYGEPLKKSLESLHIPVFLDRKESVLANAFVEYIRSLLSMADEGFSYESVFRFIRAGLSKFTPDEADSLENYVLATGIRGYKRWKSTWEEKTKEAGREELRILNVLRARLAVSLEDLMIVLSRRSKTVREMTEALFAFLQKEDCQARIEEIRQKFQDEGRLSLAKQYSQIYRVVIELFDKLVSLLGDERISLKEYCELLDSGFEEAKVGVIPLSLDEVTVGDMRRTRLVGVKALFFVGADDGNLPGNLTRGGILTEQDREILEGFRLRLSPGVREQIYIQKFYLYMKLTKPRKFLFVSYSRSSAQGKSLRSSYLVGELLRLYPDLKVRDVSEIPLKDREFTEKAAEEFLAEGLRDKEKGFSMQWKEVYSAFYEKKRERLEILLDAAFYRRKQERISAKAAVALYEDPKKFSVTRLEKFAACAYAHFLSYGLSLSEREVCAFEPVDFGNIAHQSLERFSKKADALSDSWKSLGEETLSRLSDESVSESIAAYGNPALLGNARNSYLAQRMKKLMRRTVWALSQQLSKGDFKPSGYEIRFGSGKIDRIDTCEEDGSVYVKVTDYKTGMKTFDLTALYHGLQLQLPVYLNAALSMEEKIHPEMEAKPGGIFYYRIKDPIVDRSEKEEDARWKILEQLRPDGLVNAKESVIRHFDRDLINGPSFCIPVTKNKDGTYGRNSKVISEEDFGLLLSYTKEKVKDLKERILSGEAGARPFRLKSDTGCDFCPFRDICGFDPENEECRYRTFYPLSDEALIEMMKKTMERRGGND